MMSQQRTPGNYAGQPVGPNANKTITLYAQDGQTRQTTTDQDGTISQQDYDWLHQHGGALPIDMVPQQDKALIGIGTASNVNSNNQSQTLPQRTPGNYAGQPIGPNQNKFITLYAQDGQTRQTQTNSDGAIAQEDYDWLKQHGGALPVNMIPQQDKALVGIGTTSSVNGQQQQQQQQQRTPGNYAGQPVGPNSNKTITLYAQDGQTRQTTTDQDGTISQQDYDWLKQHGGALPIDMVPQQDKALVGIGTVSTVNSNNQSQTLPQRTPGNYAGQPVGPNANRSITLYAQDGQTRQTQTNSDGAISQEDYDWLRQHGGALPTYMIPQQDKALVGVGTGSTVN